jgi:hypothetical protein
MVNYTSSQNRKVAPIPGIAGASPLRTFVLRPKSTRCSPRSVGRASLHGEHGQSYRRSSHPDRPVRVGENDDGPGARQRAISSGSRRAASSVEPTRSQNKTVSWRRSACSLGGAANILPRLRMVVFSFSMNTCTSEAGIFLPLCKNVTCYCMQIKYNSTVTCMAHSGTTDTSADCL